MFRKACFFIFVSFLLACSRISDDDESPVIAAFELNATEFSPGETFTASISGRDNEELKQVRLRIRQAFSKSFGFWELLEIREISGSTFSTSFTYQIPDTALAGLYEASLQISDERGNGSVDSTLQFLIRQPGEEPEILSFETNPPIDSDNVLRIGSKDTLTFSGVISDPDLVQSFSIVFKDELDIVLLSLNYPVPDTVLFDLSQFPDTVFLSTFSIFPKEMELKALDGAGHQRRESFEVEVN
jgi:hypothetical protein